MSFPLTVYSASAGSGKTFTLTAYYIAQLIKNPDPEGFKHLLAVTFTKKATGEMKDRILGTLYNLARIKREGLEMKNLKGEMESYLKVIGNLEKGNARPWNDEMPYTWGEIINVSEKAEKRLSHILRSYDRFRVTTIDSFFQSVLKGVARELGLPANLRTEISNDEVRRLAVERLMESLSTDKEMERQVWAYVDDLIGDDRRWSVKESLKDFSEWLFKEDFGRYRNSLDRVMSDTGVQKAMRDKLAKVKEEAVGLTAPKAQDVLNYIATNNLKEENSFKTKAASRLDAVEKRYSTMRDFSMDAEITSTLAKYMNRPETLVTKKDKDVCYGHAVKLAGLMSVAEEECQKQLVRYNSAVLSLAHLHQLGLINAISRFVTEINEEKGQFVLADTGTLLAELMGNGGNADFVFDKIGPSLDHIMIDEFQDTSRQQWTNFKPLFDELLSNGKECLIVGDIKQSLYRWRNGDWRVLAGIGTDFPGRVELVQLSENHRSEKSIVDFNNALFGRFAKMLDGLNGDGYDVISSVYGDVEQHLPSRKMGKEDNGLVRVKVAEKMESADVYADMRAQMKRLHEQGAPYGDMAILVRSNTPTKAIIDSFAKDEDFAEVNFVSGDTFQLQSSWAVRLMVAALGAIADKDDAVSDAFCRLAQKMGLKVDLNKIREWVDLPLPELNERLILELHLGDAKDQIEYISAYMDEVMGYVQNNAADITSFLEHWDEKIYKTSITTTDADAIRIVTFHTSKGLAFEHVFIPHCDFAASKFMQNDIHWVPTQEKGDPYEDLPVLPVDFYSKRSTNSLFAPDRQEEMAMQLMDAVNLVYVAFTRAKKSLYVWGVRSKDMKESSTVATFIEKALLEVTKAEEGVFVMGKEDRHFGAGSKDEAKSRIEPLFDKNISCSIAQGGLEPSYRQSTDAMKLIGNTSEELGDLIVEGSQMHDVLSLVKVADDLDAAIARRKSEAMLTEKTEKDLRVYFKRGMAQHEELRDWFSGRYRVLNEQTIVMPVVIEGLETSMPRPDRVMVAEDRVVVLDYKFTYYERIKDATNQHEKYLRQVRAYMQVLGQLFAGRRIEGYLWYLKDCFLETVNP